MITITARFNISENGGTINSVESNLNGNNVSADINNVLGKRNIAVGNPFILGLSKLGEGAYYANSLPYFLGKELSDRNGDFSSSYKITISGNNISNAIIVFDKDNGAHPNSILVDGRTYYDDDPQFELVFNTTTNIHTIEISNWNKPYSPLIITAIYADINIDIDNNNLISFTSDIIDRSNTNHPSFGVVSNSANLTFADLDERALDLITQQILHSGIKVKVQLNNTLGSDIEEQVCDMNIRELLYDNDNRQVQVTLKDGLETWQDISIEPLNYNPLLGEERTAKWIYQYLYSKTPLSFNMLSFEELDDKTKDILENTTIQYPLLERDTLWNDWQKLCELCLLHIYVDYEGRTVCKYNNGN